MIFEYSKKVKYYETDMMGIVHHSNYIRWFEEARVEFLRDIDLSYKKMEEEGIMIPVVSIACKYKTPATFDDEIVVKTTVQKYNGVVIELSYEVRRPADNALIVKGESSHCFVDAATFKPINLKAKRPDMHENFLKSVEEQ